MLVFEATDDWSFISVLPNIQFLPYVGTTLVIFWLCGFLLSVRFATSFLGLSQLLSLRAFDHRGNLDAPSYTLLLLWSLFLPRVSLLLLCRRRARDKPSLASSLSFFSPHFTHFASMQCRYVVTMITFPGRSFSLGILG